MPYFLPIKKMFKNMLSSDQQFIQVSAEQATAQTLTWVEKLVVGENLCPFAAPVMAKLAMDVYLGEEQRQALTQLKDMLLNMQQQDEQQLPTALFVLPNMLADFSQYMQWLFDAEDLLADLDLEGEIQLASFHPQYCFADEPSDDLSHFTNRSPYPMVHLIREAHISKALESVSKPEAIPLRNKKHIRRLGIAGLKSILPSLAEHSMFKGSEH